ncbi:uncharacterized protein F5891DRAFT_1058064 [Suillus fuscotomentosus]|uniref:CAP-Gly domain-containing protein n=1 Tax=Suillus fuscotomentosus TaxID=1912939 RepID=A0AAD4DZ74_9AGAM|nr:uncharacterized protein F5891DRAFT_1058064 [Suillus fuscotomentosus]KAG1895564.1 hypothetical protein F5891DRAFT_1058064 [Suillus fuscotomentosus]
MSITPGKPRVSGIPTPGKSSGIPTPGRFRSSSSANSQPTFDSDVEFMSRAFVNAIKANDPAQHRTSTTSNNSPSSSSPKSSLATLQSGRRSVTGRPSSVASTSAFAQSRTKTPGPRAPSRQSDVFTRSVSRAGKTFEVGDNVRIESLGFEGCLRYIGEIDGKSGLWAGVELSGGFSGKGKNDGSVGGKQYFVCPPNCGVFVATAKLSAPTMPSSYRPPSVASSRGGRITPSFSGRVTPSHSLSFGSGRITPSNLFSRSNAGTTPAARKTKPIPQLGLSQSPRLGLDTQITSGSRASKYIGLTAKQLKANGDDTSEYTLRSPSSPSRGPPVVDLNLHPSDSPFTTPKAGAAPRAPNVYSGALTPGLKGRTSLNTPRPRIPSAIAMPPPASPARSASFTSTYSLNDGPDLTHEDPTSRVQLRSSMDLTASSQALQDKINQLLSGQSISPPKISGTSPSRPSSVTSLRSAFPDSDLQKDALHSRLESLERENDSFRNAADAARADVALIQTLESERDAALASVSSTENQLRTLERKLAERESKTESLERAALKTTSELERVKNENEARITDLQAKLDTSESLVKSLKEAIAAKEGVEHDRDALLKAKNDEIGLLEGRLEKVSGELEADRKELNAQIDELRQAGQETIALYEERLSTADSRRYELEDRVVFLEDQVKKASTPLSPSTALQRATSAAEIDNENLREQVQHLQRKLTMLEDSLEDAHAVSEREEAAVRERIKRFKDKEDMMRSELNEGRKTVEQVLKAEALAKGRVEEVEEALRESTLALENAQAEIENLRSDVAVARLEINSIPDSQKLKADERMRLIEEIQELRDELDQLRSSAASASSTADDDTNWQAKHEQVQKEVLVLCKSLEERALELDTMKKRLNRDIPVNSIQEPPRTPTSSKQESAELMGLKHIIQDLQQETSAVTQRNKLLESENRLLMSETDQLRQELKLLEENIEQSLLREEAALGTQNTTASGDEQMSRLENELEQLRKRLTEAEMKTARVTHDLNKEIGELEALVESKIYREDELEQELERLKEKLSRNNKKSSKNCLEPTDLPPRKRSSTPNINRSSSEDVCEICERPGHDIFTCDLLRDETPPAREQNLVKKTNGDPSDLFCVDCEGHGHVAADCPHSLDVF